MSLAAASRADAERIVLSRAVSARFHIEYNGFLTNHVTHGLQAMATLGASEADLDIFFTHYASAKLEDSDKEHTPPTTSTRDGGAESAAATNRAEQHVACADVPPCNGDGEDGGWFYFCDNPPKSCLHERSGTNGSVAVVGCFDPCHSKHSPLSPLCQM
jgi:hypothetical protein